MTMRTGTRIEIKGCNIPGIVTVAPERATVFVPRKRRDKMPEGWHVVRFADGGKLAVHETNFRVIDNRKGYGA